ncbi:MAG: hypothetical protein ABEH77_02080, partial [Halobacteriaceae archaeon]
MSGTGDAPGDRLRERVGGSRLKLWLLLEADRWLVTGALLAVVFGTLTLVGYGVPTAERAIRTSDSVDTLFQALLAATITGVTLVLTLNQLVLSQELGAVGDQRERMEGAMQFRRDAAATIGTPVSPARPAQFLRALVQVAGERAADLRDAVPETDDDLDAEVGDLTDSLVENADRVSAGLDDARFGGFEVISAALDFNYSWKIFAARRIHERHGEALGEDGTEALEALIEVLRLFGPAREHFKTLYFQWELSNLSRTLLYAAVPALAVAISALVFFDPRAHTGATLGVSHALLVVSAATTVAVLPFAILLAYILRIVTVTKRTLSI